jgi:hypothetical protein
VTEHIFKDPEMQAMAPNAQAILAVASIASEARTIDQTIDVEHLEHVLKTSIEIAETNEFLSDMGGSQPMTQVLKGRLRMKNALELATAARQFVAVYKRYADAQPLPEKR